MTQPTTSVQNGIGTSRRVVYLLGAGATHGCAAFRGSATSLIMPELLPQLAERMQERFYEAYQGHRGIERLINDVVDEDTDFEQLITFLEEAGSSEYRGFAADLKQIFSTVLRTRLDQVRNELGQRHSELYAALLDMHEVADFDEELKGFLTLNYDVYLEHAIEEHLHFSVDFGVEVHSEAPQDRARHVPVLKMHGSFGWTDEWPIRATQAHTAGRWIPPGIRKEKAEYPFNTIWGLARELLDCDVLRIVGCNLGPNDWDLVSLLFATMHTHASAGPYQVEIIAHPQTAARISQLFPYLRARSLLELSNVGPEVVSEVLAGPARDFASLAPDEQRNAVENAQTKISNPFEYWLRLKGELMNRDLLSLETPSGIFAQFVESTG